MILQRFHSTVLAQHIHCTARLKLRRKEDRLKLEKEDPAGEKEFPAGFAQTVITKNLDPREGHAIT
jgi:hypothetical protein